MPKVFHAKYSTLSLAIFTIKRIQYHAYLQPCLELKISGPGFNLQTRVIMHLLCPVHTNLWTSKRRFTGKHRTFHPVFRFTPFFRECTRFCWGTDLRSKKCDRNTSQLFVKKLTTAKVVFNTMAKIALSWGFLTENIFLCFKMHQLGAIIAVV